MPRTSGRAYGRSGRLAARSRPGAEAQTSLMDMSPGGSSALHGVERIVCHARLLNQREEEINNTEMISRRETKYFRI